MEAASVAWHPLGWKPVGFSEIEPFPCAILKHRFPDTPNYGSLTDYAQWPIERGAVDLLVGGTPCQSFSVAGLRKGLEDPRGNLALVFLGLADRIKPRWIVWENVPGVLSSNGGRDFGSFLGALVQLGYGFAYRVLDAQHFGVPQRRRRVFVVACLGDWRAPAEVLFEPDCVRRDPKKGRAKGQGAASGVEGGVGADHPAGCWWDGGQVSQTLDAVLQKGQTMPDKNRFPAVLQPKPVVIDRAAFNQGQNAQPISHWDGGPHPTLNQSNKANGSPGYSNQELFSQGGGGLVPAIPYRKSKRAQSDKDDETWVEGDVSNTLNNFDLGDTRTTHAVVEPFAWTQNQREEVRILGDKAGAVTLPGTHQSNYIAEPVTHPMPGSLAPTVTSSGPPYSRTGNERVEAEALVATPMAVRRLTPVECERLQGFPDNWSRIPWKGKPEEDCPDGPRYKACGNSMAVPVMRWIGERIASVEARNISRP